jgi:hypothetical protein
MQMYTQKVTFVLIQTVVSKAKDRVQDWGRALIMIGIKILDKLDTQQGAQIWSQLD